MIHSQRSQEGYLIIDHRDSPGVTTPVKQHDGTWSPILPAGVAWESAVKDCCHCQVRVILNPDRSRPRGYCAKCDAYLCDACTALGECRPFAKVIDDLLEQAVKATP